VPPRTRRPLTEMITAWAEAGDKAAPSLSPAARTALARAQILGRFSLDSLTSDLGRSRTSVESAVDELEVSKLISRDWTGEPFWQVTPSGRRLLADIRSALEAAHQRRAAALPNPIAALRIERGITQEAFAEKVGLSRALISRIETGTQRSIDTDMCERIADVLEVDASWVFDVHRKSRKDHLPFTLDLDPDAFADV
jgi:DNA-binding XRE family transcriptional regulator